MEVYCERNLAFSISQESIQVVIMVKKKNQNIVRFPHSYLAI